jgi:glycerophosphoryl diester phosphodiesterase
MNSNALFLKLFVLCLIGTLLLSCEKKGSHQQFILVAHRGVIDEGIIENSLASLDETIKKGYTHIEVDLKCLKDGTIICFHDRTLKRVFGIDRVVSELTFSELRNLTSNSGTDSIPTFEEFCSRCRDRIDLMPDIKKCKPNQIDRYVSDIERILKKYNLIENALIIGDTEVVEKFYGIAKIAWRDRLEVANKSDKAVNNPSSNYFIFNHGEHFNEEEINGFHEMGLQVIVSINAWHYLQSDPQLEHGKADIERLIDLGIDGLQIDSQYGDFAFSCLNK